MVVSRRGVRPNKRLKLAGGDRFKGSGVLCPWRGTDCRPRPLRRRASRPQLKRDPLGSPNPKPHSCRLSPKPLFTSSPTTRTGRRSSRSSERSSRRSFAPGLRGRLSTLGARPSLASRLSLSSTSWPESTPSRPHVRPCFRCASWATSTPPTGPISCTGFANPVSLTERTTCTWYHHLAWVVQYRAITTEFKDTVYGAVANVLPISAVAVNGGIEARSSVARRTLLGAFGTL